MLASKVREDQFRTGRLKPYPLALCFYFLAVGQLVLTWQYVLVLLAQRGVVL